MHDPYHAAIHGIAALRRVAERDGGALLGALGVAAEPLPHQIATVRRILAATEIRHLIADGVGLGKTIQALMIINALRIADPSHRTLIVAPRHLIGQWAEEVRTRAHVEPIFSEHGDDDGPCSGPIEIVSPAALLERRLLAFDRSRPDDRHDLLVLDEPQSYTQDQRRALANAVPFSQLLLLSATPGLGDPRMREHIFALVEPERTAIDEASEAEPGATLAADERVAAMAVADGRLTEAEAFERYSAVRRICRWSRADWPQITPPRSYRRIDVPPHRREAILAERAAREARLAREGGAGEPLARAQSLHRIGDTARAMLRTIGEDVAVLDDEVRGDSRFDALLDELASLWSRSPEARVLIVAGDNPTIDRLERRLPQFFDDPETGGPLAIATFSRTSTMSADEAVAEAHRRIDPFIRGEARILLIGQWAQAGLNLQHATNRILFYSCPWNIRDVDQLIGRIDRLRKGTERLLRTAHAGEGVEISVITWRGSPEARVVDGIERLGVFEAPVAPTSLEAEAEIRDLIADLAAGHRTPDAHGALVRHRGDEIDAAALSIIADYTPHHPAAAWELYNALASRAATAGALRVARPGKGLRARAEDQAWAWLASLHATRFLDCEFNQPCTKDKTVRATRAWYADPGTKVVDPPVRIEPFDRTTTWRLNAADGGQAFNIKREHLPQPPASRFHAWGNPRRLGFFDHGDALHDEMCRAFLAHARKMQATGSQVLVVDVPHGAAAARIAGPVLLSAYMISTPLPPVRAGEGPADARGDLLKRHHAGCAADDRFIRLARPGSAVVIASRWDASGGRWIRLPDDELSALVDPRDMAAKTRAANARRCRTVPLPPDARARLDDAHRAHDACAAAAFPPAVSVDDRIAQITLDADRQARALAAEAAGVRATASTDAAQRRMVEARAANLDRQAECVVALARERSSRLERAASAPANASLAVRLLLQTAERPA